MSQVSTSKLRIAVVGAGAIGKVHIEAVRCSPDCTLSAIVDPSPSAVTVATDIGVPLHASIAALLSQDRPDGLILATPNPLP